MASAPQQAENPRGFGVDFGVSEHDGTMTFQEAAITVQKMDLSGPLKPPRVSNREPGSLKVGDLPLRLTGTSSTKLVHFVDVVTDYDGPLNFGEVEKIMTNGECERLPDKMRLGGDPGCPCTMQLVILPKDGKHMICKHVVFHKVKVPLNVIRQCCTGGQPYVHG